MVIGPWARVSGTTGYDYDAMTISEDVAEQADQALRNISKALRNISKALRNISKALATVGMGLEDVVRVRYRLPHREDAEACYPVFGQWFRGISPAATMEVVGLLGEAMRIEIEVTAYRPEH